jgi:hypothetical protein
MAISTCVKCNGHHFEVKEAEPNNAKYKQVFVQCAGCGAVVGVVPYYDPGVVSKDNQQALGAIDGKLDHIVQELRRIKQALNQ